jgi:hypothetical protein
MIFKRLALFSALVLAVACGGSSESSGEANAGTSAASGGGEASGDSSPPPLAGADRDEHGCIGSAGDSWCEREHACVRPWELASQRGFEASAENFAQYCAGH